MFYCHNGHVYNAGFPTLMGVFVDDNTWFDQGSDDVKNQYSDDVKKRFVICRLEV